jgi:hypothetical protein
MRLVSEVSPPSIAVQRCARTPSFYWNTSIVAVSPSNMTSSAMIVLLRPESLSHKVWPSLLEWGIGTHHYPSDITDVR